jgi:lipoprotein-releasing system permease protein
MNGFEKATHKKLQGIHADITITRNNQPIDFPKLKKVLLSEFKDSIAFIAPSQFLHVLIKPEDGQTEGHICLLKAVDPTVEKELHALKTAVSSSHPHPWEELRADGIFIGHTLAAMLTVQEGSTIHLIYPDDIHSGKTMNLEQKVVRIAGIFKTGAADFDEKVIIGSQALAQELSSSKVTHVSIQLKDPAETEAIVARLKKRIPLDIFSWKELYPQLLSALTLEKYAMIFILALICLVASMTIISLLFMYATHKRYAFALLKTMGMSDRSLTVTFVTLSLLLTLCGTTVGILCAWGGTLLLNTFPFIKLPDTYFVTHLPAELDIPIVIAVLLLATIVSIIAALLPARSLRSMRVADVLKGLPL